MCLGKEVIIMFYFNELSKDMKIDSLTKEYYSSDKFGECICCGHSGLLDCMNMCEACAEEFDAD